MLRHLIIVIIVIVAHIAAAGVLSAQPAAGSADTSRAVSTPHERAESLARSAVEAVDAGQIDRALTLLDSAITLDPSEPSYRYEKGYALLLRRDFDRGLEVVEPLLRDTSAPDYFYQLAATLHAARGDTAAAGALLRRGLELHPSSGPLHLEIGGIAEGAGDYHRAVVAYERGMRAAPAYPDNYLRAATILARSSELVWGIIYGEIFMNLERQTERTARMGELLLATYRKAIDVGADTSFAIRFSENVSALQITGSRNPEVMVQAMERPEWLYEMTAMQALAVSDHCRNQGVSLDCLDQLRTAFIRQWFSQGYNEKFPSPLFDWQKLLLDLGYFDEYNRWLLGAGDPEEFYAWVESEPESFDQFQKWFRVNGMVMR